MATAVSTQAITKATLGTASAGGRSKNSTPAPAPAASTLCTKRTTLVRSGYVRWRE